ncbi:MAG: pyrroloquinoline quinone-dependent dehydrogenase [Gammaproteobacteria bacterium]|nr:pyrroloquinoline quinone-dependent dehydrogenase [Gammaproteobacteria bacterium]MYE29603.1 pyrroloquinoline quinone-dependent dehydrogenase [Gammaproteobacteria bacterium]
MVRKITKVKVLLFATIVLMIASAVLVLGGSIISLSGNAARMDISGFASESSRPVDSVDVGEAWSHYGGDSGGHRYSQANQIDRGNVAQLALAWQYSTGDMLERTEYMSQAATEGTPIFAAESLVFCTPFNEVIALDPGTGLERWSFDAEIDLEQNPANGFVCRGVAYYQSLETAGACAERIFMGTNDGRLVALDAYSGRPCNEFGANGEIHIDPGMELIWPGEFQITSPPVTIGDTVIIGSAIGDNARVVAPAGTVRAFDADTGEPRWAWDPIPRRSADPAASSWEGSQPPQEGHANAWAPLSVDEGLGLVFIPTSSPSPDFYGGLRPGANLYANSVVALEAVTGQIRWSFQTVHHDVWDYDVPAQPGLYSVWRDGALHDVVAQVTKTGLVFVIERATGEPWLPIEERPVPQNGVAGESLSPTQPFPVLTPPVVPNRLSPDDAFGLTLIDRLHCRRQISRSVADGLYTPPSEQGTLLYPFTGGGANWGGAAFDPKRNLLVINMNSLAHHVQLIPAERVDEARRRFPGREVSPQTGAPYGMKREVLLSPLGIPCTPPPWGVLAGIDLSSGEIVWRKSFGEMQGVNLGLPSFGGPIVTAGDLVFIGGSMDNFFRAFDVSNGQEVWRWQLPAAGMATPMTYLWQDRQYVVIYAGGNEDAEGRLGDSILAFALE